MKIERNARVLCWDETLIDQQYGVRVEQHKPVKQNIALRCDDEWEGVHNGYAAVMKTDDGYRMYYCAHTGRFYADGKADWGKGVVCVAESKDGIHFKKPRVGKYSYNGVSYNNIVFMREEFIDNFSVFYDTNPDCPKDEKYKALSSRHNNSGDYSTDLVYYASEDGYNFREIGPLDVHGAFDSYNVTLWDPVSKQYYLFYRNFHTKTSKEAVFSMDNEKTNVRDVSVATSKDFKHWEFFGHIEFAEDKIEIQLYTNQIVKYYRSKNTFIGFPMRYIDRKDESYNFAQMPLADRHEFVTKYFGREGTVATDVCIMTSEDGKHFDRRDEVFLSQGPEARNNWWYGNKNTVYGIIETEADEEGAANEISFFAGENYRINHVNFRRYTVRLDGYFSWYAPFKGGEILTKPCTFDGDTLKINFATSSLSGMSFDICDEDGNVLDGYQSGVLFGDSVNRRVDFKKPLADLKGKTVRFKIRLSDAHLYSFIFE